MLPEYYQMRGWNTASGMPMKDRLVELELDDIANDLYDK
jgi:aldehyde:ferredoxin oxidoreductase